MNKEAVLHVPYYSYAHPIDKDTFVLRLRTAKNDMKEVQCFVWDRFDKNDKIKLVFEHILTDKLYDYYEAAFRLNFKRLAYSFFLQDMNGYCFWYNSKGFFEDFPSHGAFEIPYINEGNMAEIPEWVYNTVFYQIFVDRFSNGSRDNDPGGVLEWEYTVCRSDSTYGGDLRGIKNKLSYLQELGIGAIYLSPIFLSSSNHKYDVIDYYKIDPCFGDVEELQLLVSKAHELGIRVILDMPVNHCSEEFFAFRDVQKYGEKSNYVKWFKIQQFPLVNSPRPNYECFGFFGNMPKLNTSNIEVQDYFIGVLKYWVKEVGVDGFRFDVAGELDERFSRKIRESLSELDRDIYLIAEAWHSAENLLQGDMYHSVTNYQFMDMVDRFVSYGNINLDTFIDEFSQQYIRNRKNVFNQLVNLLDSHDTARLITKCGGNIEKLKLAYLMLFTLPGVPMIYYGDEIPMEGGSDPDCRKPMLWSRVNRSLTGYIKNLINIRKNHTAFSRGDYRTVFIDNAKNVLVYQRSFKNQKYLIAVNNSPYSNQIDIELQGNNIKKDEFMDILRDLSIKNSEGIIKLSLQAYEGAVITL